MSSSKNTSVFSLKFSDNNDEIEIIAEPEDNPFSTDFQAEFYNTIVNKLVETPQSLPPPEMSCPKCGKKYKYVSLLKTHIKTCSGKKQKITKREVLHECTRCKKSYKSKMAYIKHVMQCTQSNSAPCLLDTSLCFCCEEPLKNGHVGWIHCPNCSKSFKTNKGINRHLMLLHASTTKFKCELCNAQCSNNYILKLHRQSHNDELDRLQNISSEFKCTQCNKCFLGKTAFDIHMHNHSRGYIKENQSNKCESSHQKFPAKEPSDQPACCELKKNFRCDLCGKYLSSLGFFQRHINTHRKYNEFTSKSIFNRSSTSCSMPQTDDNTSLIKQEIKFEVEDNNTSDQFNKSSPEPEVQDSIDEMIEVLDADTYFKEVKILNGKSMHSLQDDKENKQYLCKSETNPEPPQKPRKSAEPNLADDKNKTFKANIERFLNIILDIDLLREFGWPESPVNEVLVNVLEHLGCEPTKCAGDNVLQLRENVKLLLRTVIDDTSAIENLDSDETVDMMLSEVILNST